MRSSILFVLVCAVGCNQEPSAAIKARASELSSGYQKQADRIEIKQDESLLTLREVKSRVGDLLLATVDTKQRLESLEASLVRSEPQQLGGDLESSRSGTSGNDTEAAQADSAATEPQETTRANLSQSTIPVALPPAVRSSAVKMSWNVEGNWSPTILETAKHLREDHGIIADGMSHQQMHDTHAAVHEGRQAAIKSPLVQLINRGSSCPGGVCPTVRTRRRR
jgi:hypothetical protein